MIHDDNLMHKCFRQKRLPATVIQLHISMVNSTKRSCISFSVSLQLVVRAFEGEFGRLLHVAVDEDSFFVLI